MVAQRVISAKTHHLTEMLLKILAVTKMLSRSCGAFKSTSNKLFEDNSGNVFKILKLVPVYDPLMEVQVHRVLQQEGTKPLFLGINVQNEIIDLIH